MSIEQLEERMISKQSIDENLEKQKHILKKSEVLESIYNTLNDIDKETIITFNEEYWPHLEYLSEEQVSGSEEMLKNIKEIFPRLYMKIRKNASNVVPILKEFGESREKRTEKLEKATNTIRTEIHTILMNDIKKNQLNIEQQTIENLANLLLHSPQQNIQIALKKAIEMEEIFRKQTKQINKIFIDEDPVEKSEKELNYIVYEGFENSNTINMPKITKSTTCQILYYEEDYLDCVTHQTVLIDIRENIMKFGGDIKIFTKNDIKENIKQNERLKSWLCGWTKLNLDYYFVYEHKRKGDQCIGGILLKDDGLPIIHIINTHDCLRYGTKYIKENNREYRQGSCTKDGDIAPELVAKDTIDRARVKYKMI